MSILGNSSRTDGHRWQARWKHNEGKPAGETGLDELPAQLGAEPHTRPRRNRPSWPCRVFLALGQSPVFNFHQAISQSTFVGQLCQDIAKISDFCSICSFQAYRWLDRTEEWCLHYTQFESAQFPDHVTTLIDRYISEFRFWKKGDVKSIELCNYAGRVETRLRTEVLWADLFRQIKPWNARWRVRLGSCLLWRRAVCGCAQILYRVPSPRNVISGHTMSNRHVWGQIQNLFIRPFFSLFLFHHLLFSVRLLHIHTSSSTRKGKTL